MHIMVHGETIGAFPVSDLPLAMDRIEPVADDEGAAAAGLVEVVSSTRQHTSRRSSSRLPSVPRPVIVQEAASSSPLLTPLSASKPYDYLLKFLLVGDSDVGKQEILNSLNAESTVSDMPFCAGPVHKVTTLLVDGRRVRLQLWDTSGQGRFCTILRSYSRGAQGLLLVYDLTNKWSFDGIDRWRREVEEHAPGVPKVLVGNRLHLEFKRQVSAGQAEAYAQRHGMAHFEISPLCNYNVAESLAELTRRALKRNGMERLWRTNRVLSLQELCCRAIVSQTSVYTIDRLPLPSLLLSQLRSYALSSGCTPRYQGHHGLSRSNTFISRQLHQHNSEILKRTRLSQGKGALGSAHANSVHAKLTCAIS